MLIPRRSAERGHTELDWLNSEHSFSFADYVDPAQMGWGNLRVINEDLVAPGAGFATHRHRDMEIITYIVAGALAHQDSMGNGTVIHAGELQRMSAGAGVAHSEFNHDGRTTTHLLQIWIEPTRRGIAPGYEQKAFAAAEKRGALRLVASPDGALGSLRMHADARLYIGLFDGDESATLSLHPARPAYVHLLRGELTVNGLRLQTGDALKLTEERSLTLAAGRDAEALVFDLAA